MGIGGSTAGRLANEHLDRLTGPTNFASTLLGDAEEHTRWNALLAGLGTQLNQIDPEQLEEVTQQLCQRFATNNPKTKNFQRLVRHTIHLLYSHSAADTPHKRVLLKHQQQQNYTTTSSPSQQTSTSTASSSSSTFSTPQQTSSESIELLNALFLLRVFCKYFVARFTVPTTTSTKEEQQQQLSQFFAKEQGEPHEEDTMKRKEKEEDLEQENGGAFPPLAFELLQALMDFCIDNEIQAENYEHHVEILNVLLILFSTQLYQSIPSSTTHVETEEEHATEHTRREEHDKSKRRRRRRRAQEYNLFLDLSYEYGRIPEFVQTMFENYIYHRQKPDPSSDSSLISTIGTAASSIIFLPWNAYTYMFTSSSSTEPAAGSSIPQRELNRGRALADTSLCVLLALAHHASPTHVNFSQNPYRSQIGSLHDLYFDTEDVEGSSVLVARVSFKELFQVLTVTLHEDASILLLYLLLHTNSMFLAYLISRTDNDTLLLPMLHLLYSSIEDKPQEKHIYMILICLLILSQDQLFNRNVQTLFVPTVPWFKERFLQKIRLGSLIVIVLVRTVQMNLSKMRDTYLHLNCLATLANMSASFEDLHPYAAHRLVKLFGMIAKKHALFLRKCESSAQVGQTAPMPPKSITPVVTPVAEANETFSSTNAIHQNTTPDKNDAERDRRQQCPVIVQSVEDHSQDVAISESFMHIVLEILNSCLMNSLRKNPHLSYALLQESEIFAPYRMHSRFLPLVRNIEAVMNHFKSLLQRTTAPTEWTTDIVLEAIERGSRAVKQMDYPLQFTYEEEENPRQFFTPYVWSIVTNTTSDLNWGSSSFPRMSLFTWGRPEITTWEEEEHEST
ncbi:Dymeclin [Balamuthia mandrillaris]